MICKYCGEHFSGGEYCSNCGKRNIANKPTATVSPFTKNTANSPTTKRNAKTNNGIFDHPAKQAEKKLRESAVFSMIAAVILCLIIGIILDKIIGSHYIFLFIGLLFGAILCLIIRDSALYKLAIMETCRKICDYIEKNEKE